MGVLPEHHRAGIGRALLEAAESWLAERDIEYLQVKTLSPRSRRRGLRRHPGLLLRLRLPAAGGDARALGGGPAGAADDQDRAGVSFHWGLVTRPEARGTDADYLRDHQYKDPTNLNARIALHAKYSRADVPWFAWLVGQVDWPEDGRVLEVGCGTGLLWVSTAALLPRLRVTLTDLSEGMVEAAVAAVAPLPGMELVGCRTCDAQDLPYDDGTFDVVVADHMLYHVPDPGRAAAEFARVLRPDGVLLAATNGPRHLDAVSEVSRAALGWSPLDFLDGRFGRSTGGGILRTAFRSVGWQLHPSTMVCTDPADVVAFIASTAAGRDATADQRSALEELVAARFAQEGGQMTITTEAGCFVAKDPIAPG